MRSRPQALPVVQLVSGTSTQRNQPGPGHPVIWMVRSPGGVPYNARVQVAGTAYTGWTLSAIPPMGVGMIRVARRGRPTKSATERRDGTDV